MSNLSNPYDAPISVADETSFGVQNFVRATQGVRLANLLLDWVILRVIEFGIGLVIGIMIVILAPGYTLGQLEGFLLSVSVTLIYYVVMEATCGRTIGKLLTRTKVVAQDGRPPTFNQIIIRSLSRFIPFEPFSFLGQAAYGWHDSFSKTYVVKA